jgi:hypothetical protein
VTTAVAAIGPLPGASSVQIASVQTPLAAAQSAVVVQQASQNTIVLASGSVAGVVAGGNPAALAATLSAQAAAFAQLGQLYQLQALLGRTSINVANAGS